MARKKKRWREMDDPAEIFDGERTDGRHERVSDPAYDAFRRHMEEHIQGETRAFHELRSTAEHELHAATVVASPPRRVLPPKKAVPTEPTKVSTMPSPIMQNAARPVARSSNAGTFIAMGLIFTAIGFLLNNAWQQSQPLTRKGSSSSKARLAADANCANEKVASPKKSNTTSKHTAAAVPVPPPAEPVPVTVVTPVPAPSVEVASTTEAELKGLTLRAVELRKGPGSGFEIVDSLPPGFAVDGVLTTDRQWLRVKPGAFVSVDAIQFQDPAAVGYQPHWVGTNIANIREFPLITARVLRKAEPGSELKLQAFNAEWAQVSGGGFVFRKLVTREAPRALQLPALMRVAVEKAEIHGGPGPNYPVLGIYFRNHRVEVQDMQSGWLRVGPDQYIRAQEMELSVKSNSDKTM
jgi:hypothetical protein